MKNNIDTLKHLFKFIILLQTNSLNREHTYSITGCNIMIWFHSPTHFEIEKKFVFTKIEEQHKMLKILSSNYKNTLTIYSIFIIHHHSS